MRRVLPTLARDDGAGLGARRRVGGQLAHGRVGDHEVVEVDAGRMPQLLTGGLLGGVEPVGGGGLGRAQGAAERGRRTSLLAVEVPVAARQREAVGLADGLAAEHLHAEAQVRAHPPDEGQLLVVLLAEHRHVGPHQPEQLGHHREHAGEVAGPRGALEDRGQRAGVDGDLRRTARVDLVDRRREEDVDALGLAERQVLVERARVAVEVLAGPELQRVHEQRHDQRGVAADLRAGASHQAGVARVHRAHRADQADALVTGAVGREQAGELRAGAREHRGHGVPQMCSRGETGASSDARDSSSTSRIRFARIGSTRPSVTTRSSVARAMATYDGSVCGAVAAISARWPRIVPDVAADDRAGQRRVAVGQRVVEGRVEQRAQGGGGVLGAGRAQQLHGLGDEGDEVVGAVGEAGVVERALVLGHEHRAGRRGRRPGARPARARRGRS